MIIVAGHLVLDPADRDAFVRDGADLLRQARATEGCLDFALSADALDDARVNVLERWISREALDAFRGDGPDDGSAARIREFHVADYEVTDG